MASLVHLIGCAEVDNPDGLVCGSMPGFGLSQRGVEQARRVGRYLGPRPVVAIWSSPLERALRTAEEIAARPGVAVRVDYALRDWEIFDRWMGRGVASISRDFPGEIEAYRNQPQSLEFAEETLAMLADRITTVARRLDLEHPHGDVVIVSHQDSVQAGRLRLIGSRLDLLHGDKPGPGAVVTLRPGTTWQEETVWEPDNRSRFGERSDLRVVVPGEDPLQPTPA